MKTKALEDENLARGPEDRPRIALNRGLTTAL